MYAIIIAIFVIGYTAIALEGPLKLDKTVPALLMGSLIWAVISMASMPVVSHLGEITSISEVLLYHGGKIAEIFFFLLCAMTIVELVNLHQGFSVITERIRTTSKVKMLWIVGFLAFFMSAVLDNLTTTIVIISLLRKLIDTKEERLWFISLTIIAVNAGGAWTPIGDVTTTMLWIGHKVTSVKLVESLFLPSLACLVVPLLILSQFSILKGTINGGHIPKEESKSARSSVIMLSVGICGLIFVPIFKMITHLPPYLGMLLSLGLVWLVSEHIQPLDGNGKARDDKYSPRHALSRIEWSSIIFFLGILLAIGGLESVVANVTADHPLGLLRSLAETLGRVVPREEIVAIILGFFSAIIDNVPLVAAVMGMYPNPTDDAMWHFIAYTAGTGGSILIIGSAAGVAAMGMERIDFIWYAKKIAWLAMAGYFAGVAVLMLTNLTS
jgi:Na+/H+ antiporter NhaD/arsenite permease-like protein